ncbi:hypothetical protein OAO65_02250 [Flavobacteriales bacterium]|nr:hypothetical protein [Flavobacteriales bacterium]
MSEISIEEENSTESNFGDAFKSYAAKLTADQVFDEPTVSERQEDSKSEYADAFAAYRQEVQPPVQNLDSDVQYNLRASMGKNPDKMSQVYNEADESGIPAPVVEANLEQIQQRKKVKDINPQKNPALARFISQRFNADVAHDDIDFLTAFEDTFTTYMGAVNSGFLTLPQTATGGTAAFFEAGGRMVERVLPDEWVQAVNEFESAYINEDYTPTGVLRNFESGFKHVSEYIGPKEQTLGTQVIGGVAQAATQMLITLTMPQASFPALMAQQVSQQEQLQTESGTDHTFMADVGLMSSTGVALSEKLGIGKMLDSVPPNIKNKIVQKLTDIAVGAGWEAATEVLEGVGHGLIEYHSTNPDAEIFKGAAENAAVGGTVGAIIRAIIPGFKGRGIKTPEERQKTIENKTNLEQDHIDKTTTLLQEGKVPTRDPKAFKRFTDEIDGDTGYKVSAEAFQDYEGDVPEFIAARDDVIGGDVKMSLDLYANEVVNNPELLASIRPHMRISEDSQTQAEVAAGGTTTVDNLMRDAAAAVEITTETEEVITGYVDQIVATGRMSKNDAKQAVVPIQGYLTTKAKELNIGVKDLADKMGLTIQKLDPKDVKVGDEKISQEHIVNGKKVKVREKKQVVYDRKLKQKDMVTKLRDCVNG